MGPAGWERSPAGRAAGSLYLVDDIASVEAASRGLRVLEAA